MTEHLDPLPAGPQRPRVEAGRLWAGGLATAVVAALIALVGVLIVRAVLRISLYAPATAGAFGGEKTVVLCLVCAAAATVLPFTYAESLPIAFAQAIIHLVVGAAIGSLLSGAAANATRPMHVPQGRFHVDEYGD